MIYLDEFQLGVFLLVALDRFEYFWRTRSVRLVVTSVFWPIRRYVIMFGLELRFWPRRAIVLLRALILLDQFRRDARFLDFYEGVLRRFQGIELKGLRVLITLSSFWWRPFLAGVYNCCWGRWHKWHGRSYRLCVVHDAGKVIPRRGFYLSVVVFYYSLGRQRHFWRTHCWLEVFPRWSLPLCRLLQIVSSLQLDCSTKSKLWRLYVEFRCRRKVRSQRSVARLLGH